MQTLQQKLKELKHSGIIMLMVDGLEARHYEIDMNTFGDSRNGVCYGCAATNALCELTKIKLGCKEINFPFKTFEYQKTIELESISQIEILEFEHSIDILRKGWFNAFCLSLSKNFKIEIPELRAANHLESVKLPFLRSNFTKQELEEYKNFALKLKKVGY